MKRFPISFCGNAHKVTTATWLHPPAGLSAKMVLLFLACLSFLRLDEGRKITAITIAFSTDFFFFAVHLTIYSEKEVSTKT